VPSADCAAPPVRPDWKSPLAYPVDLVPRARPVRRSVPGRGRACRAARRGGAPGALYKLVRPQWVDGQAHR